MPGPPRRRIADVLRLPAGRGARVAVVLAVLVLAMTAGIGVGLGGPALVERLTAAAPAATVPPPAPAAVVPAVQPLGTEAPAPVPASVAALLGPQVGELGELSGRVVDPVTGTVLWERDASTALVPGSTAKLLTAAAALLALEHEATLDTTVVAGTEPGTVVLVGGGDPTLSALAEPSESVYPDAARLDELVEAVQGAVTEPVTRVLVDADRYSGDVLAPGWVPADVPAGFVAPIVPVMLDGGRADPVADTSPRTDLPAQAAAAELARRLGADPSVTGLGSAPPGARVLGTVSSAPIEDLVTTMLGTSDNVLAEVLVREVALATGAEPNFADGALAVLDVLADAGFDASTTTLVDGSGLSTADRVTAELLADLLAAAADPDDATPRTAQLRPLLVGLPVAGGSGTLADRYVEPEVDDARGWVRAKTGTLTGVNSLAGTVLDIDGRLLVFALISNGLDAGLARPQLDALAASLRSCGCR